MSGTTGSGHKSRARAWGRIEASLTVLIAWLICSQIGDGHVGPGIVVGPAIIGVAELVFDRG